MSDQPKPKAPARAAQPQVTQASAPEVSDDAPRYEREELAEYLGVAPHIVAGALAEERKQRFTLDEAKGAVEAFLKHEDTSEGAQPDDAVEGS